MTILAALVRSACRCRPRSSSASCSGLATLTAATVFEALKHGGELIDTYGLLNPLIGFVAAFVSAVIAVRWLVGYLNRHGLELFGWYRIVVAAIALVLVHRRDLICRPHRECPSVRAPAG